MVLKQVSSSLAKSSDNRPTNPVDNTTTNDNEETTLNQTSNHQSSPRAFRPFLGLFYMILHASFHQLASVIIKKLPYIDPCQLSLYRHIGIFVTNLPITIYHTPQILGKRNCRHLLLLRALVGCTGFYFSIIAYRYLPLAEASIILSTTPVVTAVIARIFLKEPYGLVQSLTLAMTVFGVLLTLKLPEILRDRDSVTFDAVYLGGFMAAVGATLLTSLTAVFVRKLRSKAHFSVISLYLGIIGIVENSAINGIFIPFVPAACGWDQFVCILFGIFCAAANILMTVAIHVEPAGLAMVQKSSFDILVIIVFQIVFFSVYPDVYVTCGASVVIASLTILAIRNWILITPETSNTRRIFRGCCND